jgi:hypothetical protein
MIYLETATQIFPDKFEEYMDVWSKEILPRYEKAGRKLVAHESRKILEPTSFSPLK